MNEQLRTWGAETVAQRCGRETRPRTPNARSGSQEGVTAVHLASYNGHGDVLRRLVNKGHGAADGAIVDVRDKVGALVAGQASWRC